MYQNRNYGIAPVSFGGLIEEMFHNGLAKSRENHSTYTVPVNIRETEKSFEMEFIAPGVKKEDFKISVEKNNLNIAYEHKPETTEEKDGKLLRREYSVKSFKRNFTLNDNIDASKITAKYNEGILHVSLLKKESVEPAKQEIIIN